VAITDTTGEVWYQKCNFSSSKVMRKSGVGAMRRAEIDDYKSLLEAREAELLDALRRSDPISYQRTPEAEEEAQRTAEQDMAVQDRNRTVEMLRQIRAALDRIKDGSYGTCASCEQEIELKRLNAIPWAEYCVRCQEQWDQHTGRAARAPIFEEAESLQRRAA
jgi:DnaK suppressor protein